MLFLMFLYFWAYKLIHFGICVLLSQSLSSKYIQILQFQLDCIGVNAAFLNITFYGKLIMIFFPKMKCIYSKRKSLKQEIIGGAIIFHFLSFFLQSFRNVCLVGRSLSPFLTVIECRSYMMVNMALEIRVTDLGKMVPEQIVPTYCVPY